MYKSVNEKGGVSKQATHFQTLNAKYFSEHLPRYNVFTIKVHQVRKRFYTSSFTFYSDQGINEIYTNMCAKPNSHYIAEIYEIKSLNFNKNKCRFLREKQDYVHVE